MIITVNRQESLPTDEQLYLTKDTDDYMHLSNLRITELTSARTCTITSIDTDNVRLMDSDHAEYKNFIGLDLQAGVAICELPLEEQTAFWSALEPQINKYCRMYLAPEVTKANLVLALPNTLISHSQDESDEIIPYLRRTPEGLTVIGFTSMFNFRGPNGPDLMLAA